MRQGNGSDLLGANDPRSSTIGIIYVAPNDDRESVLAAILTQERLKRQQIAVVLPGQNRAFQRPVDFDGLKNMRNKLDATLVIIAPHGSSPAEFARQRRFTLYTSLDSYRQSLQQETEASRANRRGWSPFKRQAKPQPIPASPASPRAQQPPAPTSEAQDQMVAPSADGDHLDRRADEQHANANGAALGLGLGAGAAAAYAAEHAMHPPAEQPPVANGQANAELVSPSVQGGDDVDDDLALPTFPSTSAVGGSGTTPPSDAMQPPSVDARDAHEHPGGDIYTFSPTPNTSGRNSGKIPVPPVAPVPGSQPDEQSNISPLQRRRTGGKIAAVGAASAVGAAAGAGAAGAVPFARTASPGTGTPRPGTTGTPPPGRSRKPPRALWLLVLAALLLLSVVVCSVTALAAPGSFGGLGNAMSRVMPGLPVGNPSATVTIIPKHADEQNVYVIQAITKGTPNSSKRQVQARVITYVTSVQSNPTKATERRQTPGARAGGTLSFSNGTNSDFTVAAGEQFTGADGVVVATDTSVTIPAGNPSTGYGKASISGHAVNVGTRGNIAAGDINGTCCSSSNSIFVVNSAFTGGQDPQNYTVVSQSDIDAVANPLKGPLLQSALTTTRNKRKANEQFLPNQPTCTTNVTSDPALGQQATTFVATVTANCNGVVYDQAGAQTIAANLLRQQASKDLTPDYALVGDLVTQVLQVSTDKQGNVDLRIKAEGIWVFQFTNAEKAKLAQLIAGKSTKDAKALLQQQAGVDSVAKIDITGLDGSTLPSDPKQITIIIQPVPGLQNTPTPSPATPPVPTGTPSPIGKF